MVDLRGKTIRDQTELVYGGLILTFHDSTGILISPTGWEVDGVEVTTLTEDALADRLDENAEQQAREDERLEAQRLRNEIEAQKRRELTAEEFLAWEEKEFGVLGAEMRRLIRDDLARTREGLERQIIGKHATIPIKARRS